MLADCVSRSQTQFGSTTPYKPIEYQDFVPGAAETDAPFHNWNRFFFIYCDGMIHQGTRKDPVTVDGHKLWLRGENITRAQLDFVLKLMPVQDTDTFVINGCSAGGIAVFLWADEIARVLLQKNPSVRVLASANAGFLFDYPQLSTGINYYGEQMKVLANLTNREVAPPNSKCRDLHRDELYKCLMPVELSKLIETPLFIEESLYDNFQMSAVLSVPCMMGFPFPSLKGCNATELLQIQAFKNRTATLLQEAYDVNPSIRGVWAPSCPFHCFLLFGLASDPESAKYAVPSGSQWTLGAATELFLQGYGSEAKIDDVDWPGNANCAYIVQQS